MRTLIDLYCGRGGWTKAALARGWRAVGFDIIDAGYPGELIQRPLPVAIDELRAHDPSLILASPPCDEFARWHLPWRDQLTRRNLANLTAAIDHLKWAISLIGRPGCPVIVECSKFAARHVPGARFIGQYALWGDVPAINPIPKPKKEQQSGENPQKRAEIPFELADWIIETTPAK